MMQDPSVQISHGGSTPAGAPRARPHVASARLRARTVRRARSERAALTAPRCAGHPYGRQPRPDQRTRARDDRRRRVPADVVERVDRTRRHRSPGRRPGSAARPPTSPVPHHRRGRRTRRARSRLAEPAHSRPQVTEPLCACSITQAPGPPGPQAGTHEPLHSATARTGTPADRPVRPHRGH